MNELIPIHLQDNSEFKLPLFRHVGRHNHRPRAPQSMQLFFPCVTTSRSRWRHPLHLLRNLIPN